MLLNTFIFQNTFAQLDHLMQVMEEHQQVHEITALLEEVRAGNEDAFNRLIPRLYSELRGLARKVRYGRASATVNTTALVHEAYMKLAASDGLKTESRLHFFRVAARAMRQVLVNEAEKKLAQKRGGGHLVATFDEAVYQQSMNEDDLLALNESLETLETLNERQARIVEFRFFAGMTSDEIAELLDVSERTVHRDWKVARAWLASQIKKTG